MLKEVKQEICSTNLEIKIDAIRETKNGDLLVAVDKTEANFEKIKEALRSKMGQDKVRSKGIEKPVVLHVQRLDAVTTKEDTHAALMKAVRESVSDPNDIEVSNMRLAYGNCQTATIKVSKKATDVLLQKDRALIGLTSCKIVERRDLEKCYRCWELTIQPGNAREQTDPKHV